MSLLKTIKAQLGLSGTPANNFVLDASVDNGTMKLARGNAGATTQDIMTVAADGKVGFSVGVFGFVFGDAGTNGQYLKLPVWLSNLVFMWGRRSVTYTTAVQTVTITLPVVCTGAPYVICSRQGILNSADTPRLDQCADSTTTLVALNYVASTGSSATQISWLAIGAY
jgi:hypothetical protein